MVFNNVKKPKECKNDFNNKLVVITGATSGIGHATAREYASHGAKILSINRNEEKSKKLCEELKRDFNAKCEYLIADFEKISDIVKVANKLKKSKINIDVLIHNAGIYCNEKSLTNDGIETVFQVIYLGSFILNYILKEKLKKQKNCRIIFVNSEGHRFAVNGIDLEDINWDKNAYSGLGSYGYAKTAQLLSMIKFNEFFKGSGVTINAMHPGQVKTNMGENNKGSYLFFKHYLINPTSRSPDISAKSLYYLGVSKELEGVSGKFFNLTTLEEPAPPALDKDAAKELWKKSIELSGLK